MIYGREYLIIKIINVLVFIFLSFTFITSYSQTIVSNNNRFLSTLINPDKIIKSGSNHYFFDFGKDAF